LGFAVATHVDADILLCDEVLAVGDAGFRDRCLEHFERMLAAGKTIVLVTHDVDVVRESCDRALLLHRGRMVDLGDPNAIADRYEQLAAEALSDAGPQPTPERTRRRRGSVLGLPSLLRPKPRRFATVTRMLAATDFKLKYFDATLSYAWALLRPAIFFLV